MAESEMYELSTQQRITDLEVAFEPGDEPVSLRRLLFYGYGCEFGLYVSRVCV